MGKAGFMVAVVGMSLVLQSCCGCKKRWMCETDAMVDGKRYQGSGVSLDSEAGARDDAAFRVCGKYCHEKGEFLSDDCPCVRSCSVVVKAQSAASRATCRSSGVY